jgi:predicted dehydrogenase
MLRIVLVGAGFIAEAHLKGYLRIPGAQVTAVADVDAGRARRMAALAGGVKWTTDFREVLADADIVDICTTSETHGEIGMAAARAGKHIHVEKPFAMTMADCDSLLDACAQAGVKVMAGQTERFKPLHQVTKASIDRGDIGKLVLTRIAIDAGHFWPGGWEGWQIDPARSGGIFLHLGIHTLDLLLWLSGAQPRSIYAQTQKRASGQMDMNDYYQCIVKYQDDTTAIAELSYALPRRGDSYRALMLVGTRGSAYHKLTDDAFLISDSGYHFVADALDDPVSRQVRHFVECVAADSEPVTTPEQIRTALRLALAGDESSRTGQVVELGA